MNSNDKKKNNDIDPVLKERLLDLLSTGVQTDGAHHKNWVCDQCIRMLTNCPTILQSTMGLNEQVPHLGESDEYNQFIISRRLPEGPLGDCYDWYLGVPC